MATSATKSAPRAGSGFGTMEALALISALCIVAIFLYAQYARQAHDFDQQAQRLAKDLRPAVEAFFAAQPQGSLTPESLRSTGVAVPPGFEVTVPPYKERADDWQVAVSHPEGNKRYIITAQGVRETYR